mgnify:CR=1 FL=1
MSSAFLLATQAFLVGYAISEGVATYDVRWLAAATLGAVAGLAGTLRLRPWVPYASASVVSSSPSRSNSA